MQLAESQKTTSLQRSYTERRKFTRFTPKNGTMAVNNHALGPILDISMGGLSFRYMNDKPERSMTDLFGILLGSENILIDNIQSRIITDRIIPQNTSFLRYQARQCSIKFVDLTSNQQKKLEDFILTKTQGIS